MSDLNWMFFACSIMLFLVQHPTYRAWSQIGGARSAYLMLFNLWFAVLLCASISSIIALEQGSTRSLSGLLSDGIFQAFVGPVLGCIAAAHLFFKGFLEPICFLIAIPPVVCSLAFLHTLDRAMTESSRVKLRRAQMLLFLAIALNWVLYRTYLVYLGALNRGILGIFRGWWDAVTG